MDHTLPAGLEERISHYERPENDPGSLTPADWRVLLLTGVALPALCLVLGWFVGWTA